jgi:transcriptional regulator with XRE-family HTH domain
VSPAAVPPIGERLREERVRRGISVRGLARDIGVSASLISQIETDKSRPSVSTLYAITTALGISVEDLFDSRDGGPQPPVGAPEAPPAGEAPPAARPPERGPKVGPVIRPEHRELLTLDSGVTWERLGQTPDGHVDFLQITYPPGATSSSSGQLMRHSGTEYGFVVSGELILTLAFDEYRLSPGDAVSFESSTPHGYRNEGDVPAIGVWFVVDRSH